MLRSAEAYLKFLGLQATDSLHIGVIEVERFSSSIRVLLVRHYNPIFPLSCAEGLRTISGTL